MPCGRRWRPAEAGDGEQLREAEEEVPGEDDSGSLATAVSDMNYASTAADNQQASSPGIPAVHAAAPESTGVSSSAGGFIVTMLQFSHHNLANVLNAPLPGISVRPRCLLLSSLSLGPDCTYGFKCH